MLRRPLLRTLCTRSVAIPPPMKAEILSLHQSDSTRWNETTLAARFRAPRENVAAILRLGKRRRNWDQMGEEACKLQAMKKEMLDAWGRLGGGKSGRLAKPSASVPEVEEEKEEAEEGDKEPEIIEELEKSATAKWVETLCESAEKDVSRKTTYAFVEVGGDANKRRAIWLREGASGKLRVADEDERALFQNKVRAIDSTLNK